MRLLYIGDIMGNLGVQVVSKVLPELKSSKEIDVVAAQAENVTDGKGISANDYRQLKEIGVDFFTGGNWTLERPDVLNYLYNPDEPIIRPANYPEGTPGLGYKYLKTAKGQILFISLLGQIVGKDANVPVDNPLHVVDKILDSEKDTHKLATVVNFHGDYSSEKVVIGHYLDGRVSAVVGDHWHVPTADARVLTKGSAHITDVGMCGALNSSLGIKLPVIINRWRDGLKGRNELETDGPCQFNAVLIDVDEANHQARSIEQIQKVI
jgi:hypothetical protein